MFKSVILIMVAMLVSFSASAKKENGDERTVTTFREAKEIVVKERGDYTHEQAGGGYSNFRTREGQEERVQVRPGDRLVKEPGTLPE